MVQRLIRRYIGNLSFLYLHTQSFIVLNFGLVLWSCLCHITLSHIRVLSDILLALDSGNLAMLTLLDLSAAFDSVDHVTLLRRLQLSYGLGGTVISCMVCFISGRPHAVRPSVSNQFIAVGGTTRSTAGFSPWTNPVPPVYR